LIDCPGVVVDTAGDTEIDSVLKGVVRAERLENPEDFIPNVVEKVKREHIAGQYKLSKEESKWETTTQLLETIALKVGRLRKGGDPCLRSAAIMMINDFQRGRLPHYVAPPELKDDEQAKTSAAVTDTAKVEGVEQEVQDLDQIGEENMKTDETEGGITNDERERNDKIGGDDADETEESVVLAGDWDE
jgi:nuclear GTP-binding protein